MVGPSPSTLLRIDDDERICSEGVDHRVVQWRNVLFTHWFAPVSVGGLAACESASFDLASRNPMGVVVFNVIEFGLQIPDPAARKKASAVLASTSGHVRVTTTVIPGEGFWASAARASVATITLLSRAGHPHRVFSTTNDASHFVLPFVTPEKTPRAHLQSALSRLAHRHQA
ncbi:MAG: hypothetical protein ACRBN8_08290 [Nannocystales bacterium]